MSVSPRSRPKKIDMSKHPLLKRFESYLEKAEEGNQYDYDRIMAEINFRMKRREIQKAKRQSAREKEINFKKKLKEMDEYRQNLMEERRKKIEEKQKTYLTYLTELNKEKKKKFEVQNAKVEGKMDKAADNERKFCEETEKKINSNLENMTNQKRKIQKEYLKKYKSLTLNVDKVCDKSDEIKKEIMEKKESELKERSILNTKKMIELNKNKKEEIINKKEKENSRKHQVIEKKKEIQRELEEERKALIESSMKQRNDYTGDRIKIFVNKLQNYDKLQKQNYEDVIKEMNMKSNILKERHFLKLSLGDEFDRYNDKIAKRSQKNALEFNSMLIDRYENYLNEVKDISSDNLINKSYDERMKMYYKMKQEE
ncbi:MAG: hypothetical protein MJ252_10980, partial [archaeon]|nr:hypothetical protein [archaeon]